jgi:hypothetical protein
MRSYPNLIPLSAHAVQAVLDNLQGFTYDRLYGGWSGRVVQVEAQMAVTRSAERYLKAIEN